ncbi:MAG: AIPR family protein [Endozoicomonadaceae bacterium]|nr:AIPR family protein [Endozoicomonadaceae bacterium]
MKELNIVKNDDKQRSVALTVFAIKKNLGKTEEEAYECIVDGGQDQGIDGIDYDEIKDNELLITIFQSKYKQNLDGNSSFPENAIMKIKDAIEELFKFDCEISVNKRLNEKLEEIRGFIAEGKIPSYTVILCNNGQRWSKEADKKIKSIKEKFAGYVNFEHMGVHEFTKLAPLGSIDAKMTLTGKSTHENFDFKEAIIGRLPAKKLADIMEKEGDNLLQGNIRDYLKYTKVNKDIIETLDDPEKKKDFYFLNNGITFICEDFIHSATLPENRTLHLEGLQLINGGQTARTIQKIAQEKGRDYLEGVDILVKFYKISNNEEFINNIIYATNNQNPIDLRDLKANDDRQRRLKQSIDSLPDVGIAKLEYRTKRPFTNPNELTNAVVAEAVLAIWRMRPHQARFNTRQHFGTLYDIIFTNNLNGAQAIIAVLIHRFCETERKRQNGEAPAFLLYGSRFIAMQMGRYLLRDLKMEKIEELVPKKLKDAYEKFDREKENYYSYAIEDVGDILPSVDSISSLQQVSAFFRRNDSVEKLKNQELKDLLV